jgi:hypothetical protein
MRDLLKGRRALLGFGVGVVVATAATAGAAGLITGRQIKRGTITARNLSPALRKQIAKAGKPGPQGQRGDQGPAGTNGHDGAAGIGLVGLYGNGADGDGTVSGSTTLTDDHVYANLTLAPGAVLNTAGHRIFVRDTLTLGDGSRIADDGLAASTSAGGAGAPAATVGGGTSGAPPNTVGALPSTTTFGGDGGKGGGTFTIPGVTGQAPSAAESIVDLKTLPQALLGRLGDGVRYTGGVGGSGQYSSGGGGGGGGGVLIVAARRIVVNGSAALAAAGGAGGPGGGGGGGGVVIVVSQQALPDALSLSAAGGSGGGAGAGPSVAADGGAGRVVTTIG